MLKRILLALLVLGACYHQPVYAGSSLDSQIKVLTKDEVAKLTDDELIAQYVDVVVELEAKNTFYRTSGMVPRDFAEHKSLIRYRITLVMEIHNRNLETPSIESRQ